MTESPPNPPRPVSELTVITKCYDLVRELTRRVAKFPRDFKFLLGDRVLANGYDLLDSLLEAKYSKEKRAILERANLRLEQMRFQIRLAYDEKLMGSHQYEVVSRMINEVGRLVGGWRKSISGASR